MFIGDVLPDSILPGLSKKVGDSVIIFVLKDILIELSKRKTLEFNKKFIGRAMPVLIEQEVNGRKGYVEGFTPNYIKVICEGDKNLKGEIVNVSLKEAVDDFIIGRVLDRD